MAGAAVWAVNLYVRKQRPAWITVGAGARIGLVTGLLGGWFAFAVSGASMAASRFLFGGAKDIDGTWKSIVDQVSARWQEMSPDPQTSQIFKQMAAWLLTPQGHAGSILGSFLTLECGLLIFAAAGGAIGARLLARSRQPKG